MNLSKNFTLAEMYESEIAIRRGLDNIPPTEAIDRLRDLCVHVLQPLRDRLGKPLKVTSGYRCPAVNTLAGGRPNSQHKRGEAADIKVDGMTPDELFNYIIESGIECDQLIQEFNGWVHVSFTTRRKKQRMDIKYAKKIGKETVFIKYEKKM